MFYIEENFTKSIPFGIEPILFSLNGIYAFH